LHTGAGTFLVRRFSHGGLLRFVTRDRFRDASRPFEELAVAAILERAGVGTPRVAAARARPAAGWGWNLEVVTRRVEEAVDLDEALASARAGRVDRRILGGIALAAGALVRAVHEAGCRHADLTTKNMLVNRDALDGGPPRLWILDLDRACRLPSVSNPDRIANLARLHRYVERREDLHGTSLSRTDRLRFLAGYERDRSRRRGIVEAVLAERAKGRRRHALGWWLESLFAGRARG
jgi:tRNA A-37 threonylcarbamoyl transferase component Bud32